MENSLMAQWRKMKVGRKGMKNRILLFILLCKGYNRKL
jgi:hypothetical protein